LGNYFTKILKYHYLPDKSPAVAAKQLGVHTFFLKDYEIAARNFNRAKTFEIIHQLSAYDLKTKGLDVGPFTESGEIIRELVFKILNSYPSSHDLTAILPIRELPCTSL